MVKAVLFQNLRRQRRLKLFTVLFVFLNIFLFTFSKLENKYLMNYFFFNPLFGLDFLTVRHCEILTNNYDLRKVK